MEGREGKGIQPIYRVWGYLESPDPCSAAAKKKEKIEKGIGLHYKLVKSESTTLCRILIFK